MAEDNAVLLAEIKALIIQVEQKAVQIDGSQQFKDNAQTFFKTGLLWIEHAAKTK